MVPINFPLDPDAFRRHDYRINDPTPHLYHVYDNLSQTRYIPGNGIRAGDGKNYTCVHPQHVMTYSNMTRHLDWANREPTPFISLTGSLQAANDEADRRRRQLWVPGQTQPRLEETVRIARISVVQLHNLGVFYFSREELLTMLRAPPNNPVFFATSPEWWFALEHIPDGAVDRILE